MWIPKKINFINKPFLSYAFSLLLGGVEKVWDTIVGNNSSGNSSSNSSGNSSGNSNSGNILVHCSDGMQRSGILLTLISLIQVNPSLAII